jgi:hypothetical protein
VNKFGLAGPTARNLVLRIGIWSILIGPEEDSVKSGKNRMIGTDRDVVSNLRLEPGLERFWLPTPSSPRIKASCQITYVKAPNSRNAAFPRF